MKQLWPIIPDYITENPDNETDGFGIIDKDHLIGIITEDASHLENPVTIVEFLPNNRLNRIDSMSIHYDLHPPCRKFRGDLGCENYCLRNDELHANIFRELHADSLEFELNKIIKNPQSEFHRKFRLEYYINPIIDVVTLQTNNTLKVFLKYECPILGYRELLFPVIIEGRVIGVLFVGELVLEENLELIDSIRTKYFNKSEFLSTDLEEEMALIHKEFIKNRKNVLTKEKYDLIIEDILKRIKKLEKRLEDILIEKRIKYINEKISLINQIISNNFSDSIDFGLSNYWDKTTSLLAKLSSFFPVEFICIFGTKDYSSKPTEKLTIQAFFDSGTSLLKDIQYDLTTIPVEYKSSPSNSMEYPVLLKGLVSDSKTIETDSEKDLVRIIPTVKNPRTYLIIWVRYNNLQWARLKENESHRKEFLAFSNAIMGFYTLLAFKFSSLWAEIAQERLETIFRIIGHEIGQVIAEINQRYWSPFNDYNYFRYLDKKGFQDLKDDFDNFLRQLAALKYNSKFLIDELEPKKREFFIFDEILFKWKETYKRFTDHKKIHIKVFTPNKDDLFRPVIFADPVLIEQIVYNLLRNAIKYSYRGTNIWLDCFKEDTNRETSHILKITSYGIPIIEDDSQRIYELHERGSNTIQNDKNSQGIGLFLVKKIILAHKGTIHHSSEKVSDYYLPFLQPFLENPALRDHPDYSNILKVFQEIQNSNILKQCCALTSHEKPLFYPSYRELVNKIKTPIFETVFYVTIPPKAKPL